MELKVPDSIEHVWLQAIVMDFFWQKAIFFFNRNIFKCFSKLVWKYKGSQLYFLVQFSFESNMTLEYHKLSHLFKHKDEDGIIWNQVKGFQQMRIYTMNLTNNQYVWIKELPLIDWDHLYNCCLMAPSGQIVFWLVKIWMEFDPSSSINIQNTTSKLKMV